MNKKFSCRLKNYVRITLALSFGFTAAAQTAYGNDAQPWDFKPMPSGTNLGLVYYSHTHYNRYEDKNGDKVPNSELDADIWIARYVRYFMIGDMLADVNILQPFGGFSSAKIGGNDLSEEHFGLGDTTLVFTLWPYINEKSGVAFGVANYLSMPTGEYDSDKDINIGSNRWSFSIQPGLVLPLTEKFSLDLVGDVTFYGDNDDGPGGATVEQDPSFTVLGWLNYSVSPKTLVSVGAMHTEFGKQEIRGVSQGDGHATTVRAAVGHMIEPTVQLMLQFSHDVSVENNFKQQTGILVRVAKFF